MMNGSTSTSATLGPGMKPLVVLDLGLSAIIGKQLPDSPPIPPNQLHSEAQIKIKNQYQKVKRDLQVKPWLNIEQSF